MIKALLVAVMSLPLMAASGDKHEHLCEFAPENNLYIPATEFTGNGMTEEVFNQILVRIDKHYRPIVEGKGKKFRLEKDWNDGTVNAYAQQQGNTWIIKMFGGLARHKLVTPDGFALVACHEMGHHLGGAPRRGGWASNEGQSDYYATTKCARRIWAEDNNAAIMQDRISKGLEISEKAQQECDREWQNQEERALCLRSAMAGLSLGDTLADLGNQGKTKIETPDTSKVGRTNDRHPKGQCRTDTYYQGALCEVSYEIEFDSRDPEIGACTRAKGHTVGMRPLCWYKPPGSGGGGDDGGGDKGECPFGDQSLCDQLCEMNPNYPFCKK